MELRIAEDLALPLEAVTETFAILGKRDAGKTNTAVDLAEEMLSAGQQAIAIDPVGTWWGLRSTREGEPSQLPILIFGGQHADLPLPPGSGARVAELLVEENLSAVIDVSDYPRAVQLALIADFIEAFYLAKSCHPSPVHIFVEEADVERETDRFMAEFVIRDTRRLPVI